MNTRILLYIDDDTDDLEIMQLAAKTNQPDMEVVLCKSGLEGLQYLQKNRKTNELLPCIIILDINMPGWDGRQTLRILKTDILLKNIPVVIYTSSHNPKDKSYFNNQNIDLINKPSNFSQMKGVLDDILNHCTC